MALRDLPATRRELRGRVVDDRILVSARLLFASRGFDGISMEAIADQIGRALFRGQQHRRQTSRPSSLVDHPEPKPWTPSRPIMTCSRGPIMAVSPSTSSNVRTQLIGPERKLRPFFFAKDRRAGQPTLTRHVDDPRPSRILA